MNILIVDPDRATADLLAEVLTQLGYRPDVTVTVADARKALKRKGYGLMIIDPVAPSGAIAFMAEARQFDPLLRIVVFTAAPSRDLAVTVLEGGPDALAVEYIAKPVSNLLERFRQVTDQHFGLLVAGPFVLSVHSRTFTVGGRTVELTPTDMQLMRCFMMHPNQMIPYETLAAAIGRPGLSHAQAVRGLRGQLSRLRSKLYQATGTERVLVPQRGQGNMFVPSAAVNARTPAPAG